MKKLLPLLSVLFLISWGCGDKDEGNIEEPTITISHGLSKMDINWTMSQDRDFFKYTLFGSNSSSMNNSEIILETLTRDDTTYVLSQDEYFEYYQVNLMKIDGKEFLSNIIYPFVFLFDSTHFEYRIDPYSIKHTTSLDFSYWGLSGEIPSKIGQLVNLNYLDFSVNFFSGIIPTEIGDLTNLIDLRISNVNLNGGIPSEIGGIDSLKILDLSTCTLDGSIPLELWTLNNLTSLNLSENQFNGSISQEIINLNNLDLLFLSHNNLSGKIPDDICDLNINWSDPFHFNISNNQFCPPYPSCIEDYMGEQDTSGCD